jgi:hypothetical protein
MNYNSAHNEDEVIWSIKPWIIPSLAEETVMAVIVFLVSFFAELYFGSAFTPISGVTLVVWTGLGLALIWVINALHLLLVRSTSRFTLRRDGLKIQTGILIRETIVVSALNFSDVIVMQSIMGKIMGSGEMFVRFHEDRVREGRMSRVQNPFVVEKDIRKIMSVK